MRSYSPIPCRVCGKTFTRTGARQWRCHDCTSKGLRDEKPPKCECGCGEAVTWSLPKNAWNRFLRNHHNGVVEADYSGRVPWNKGNLTEYRHTCERCGKTFKNLLRDAKYCSRKCYHGATTGEGSHLWRGGSRTAYRHVTLDGRRKKVHRVVMAEFLGRSLRETEVVHHIDNDGRNNDISNLHLFHCDACHRHHHATDAKLAYVYTSVHLVK